MSKSESSGCIEIVRSSKKLWYGSQSVPVSHLNPSWNTKSAKQVKAKTYLYFSIMSLLNISRNTNIDIIPIIAKYIYYDFFDASL